MKFPTTNDSLIKFPLLFNCNLVKREFPGNWSKFPVLFKGDLDLVKCETQELMIDWLNFHCYLYFNWVRPSDKKK